MSSYFGESEVMLVPAYKYGNWAKH